MTKYTIQERRLIQALARSIQLEAEKERLCTGYILEKMETILIRLNLNLTIKEK